MRLQEFPVKGIGLNWLDTSFEGEPLHMHISEVGPGGRSHPPHQHGGYEAFYMLEGEGILELGDEVYTLAANQSAVFDPRTLHGLRNDSDRPMRYLVILVRQVE